MSIKNLFDETEVNEEGSPSSKKKEMDRIKDGTYKAVVTEFSVFEKQGEYYVSWWFEVTDGLAAGANLQSFSSVTDRSVRFIKRSVARVIGSMPTWEMMYDEDLRQSGIVRSSIEGRKVQITQKTNESNGKKYVNVYVDKVLAAPKKSAAPAKEEPPAAPVTESDEEVDVDDLF